MWRNWRAWKYNLWIYRFKIKRRKHSFSIFTEILDIKRDKENANKKVTDEFHLDCEANYPVFKKQARLLWLNKNGGTMGNDFCADCEYRIKCTGCD